MYNRRWLETSDLETRPEILHTLIANGDGAVRETLRSWLTQEPGIEVVGTCADGHAAVESLLLLRPDAIFIDVDMPGLPGLDVLRSPLVARRPLAVITAPDGRQAIPAFELHAVDYLLRPLQHERFRAAVLRLREQVELESRSQRRVDVEALLRQLRSAPPRPELDRSRDRVPIRFGTRYRFLNMSAIRYILAQRDYVDIHMQTDEVLHASDRISEAERKLPSDRFIRIHRSVIINTQHVKEVRSTHRNYEIIMNDNRRFSAGTTYRTKVRRNLLTAQQAEPEPPPALHLAAGSKP